MFLIPNIDFVYSLEQPRRGGSNVYQQSMFLKAKLFKISNFSMKFSFFTKLMKKRITVYWMGKFS